MRLTRKLALSAVFLAMFLAGCKKKHPVQPAAPPPVLQSQPSTPPQTAPSGTQASSQAPASQPEKTTPPPQAKPKPKKVHKPVNSKPIPKKPAPVQPPPANDVPRITIAEGSQPNAPGDLSASLPHTDEEHAKETTAQLIAGAELNLKGITRQLSPDEQNTLAQIRSFILQSQQATKEGDDFRAHNLALKAHLLSDALTGAR